VSAPLPRVFTIAPDQNFLELLADSVLSGFPGTAPPGPLDLGRWTILLPTRRSVRELERIFVERIGGRALLLPRIRPIGDIDEDQSTTADPSAVAEAPDAMSPAGQLLLLIDLIDAWASSNPQTRLAAEIAAAPHQAHALALSLAEFLDGVETEEIDTARLQDLYGLESARHREAILEFLGIAREHYPARLEQLGLASARARRSQLLRREARRLAETAPQAPVIAAGSTGSIPATRELLHSIACLPNGAVILPGLDRDMDDASWSAVGPTHPQHALKLLLQSLGIERHAVAPIDGRGATERQHLASEIMRPADTSEAWRDAIAGSAGAIGAAMRGVELIEARDGHEQATAIALVLKQSLAQPGKTASLVTPDRELARRVKAELLRWNIAIDDSAGEPLIRSAGGSLIDLLIDAVLGHFAPAPVAALMRHGFCRFGATAETARRSVSVIELALFRSGESIPPIDKMADRLRQQWPAGTANPHRHPVLQRISHSDWEAAAEFARRFAAALHPFQSEAPLELAGQLQQIVVTCETMAGPELWQGEGGEALRAAIRALEAEAHQLRRCDFRRAAAILRHSLALTMLHPAATRRLRLSILGLLEARLIRPDLVVLGGLNEGTWPAAPDAGPWLNRPMRDLLGMQQPERDIGQTAHDFVQALGAPEVKLVWSRRIGDAPAIASRWILRLQMLLKTAGLEPLAAAGASQWTGLARRLAEPAAVVPLSKPRPCPPLAARPRKLSVTQIETLIRDPYAIYARNILKLEPVGAIEADADPARRGIVIHGAIGEFLASCPLRLPADTLAEMLRFGTKWFEPLRGEPGVYGFWWPRFRRIAAWLADEETIVRPAILRVHAEVGGAMQLAIGGNGFSLTCRADRIDELADGLARVIDYKTGTVPTSTMVKAGLSPQLTLQAAILEAGGFPGIGALRTCELAYVKLSGGEPPGEFRKLDLGGDVLTVAHEHLTGLTRLLTVYASPSQSYLPRVMMKKEDDEGGYDHLSRFREWALAGGGP